jgi:bifunctional DNA-binding transcriptional regulator/antitoxin component of YhaV-PrlF toxin-antitoxin module
MLVKKTSKNQLTLPKNIVKAFPDVECFDVTADKNRILLVPIKIASADAELESIRDKMEKLAITEADVKEAVTWARKRKSVSGYSLIPMFWYRHYCLTVSCLLLSRYGKVVCLSPFSQKRPLHN